jgi:hypothetical protein
MFVCWVIHLRFNVEKNGRICSTENMRGQWRKWSWPIKNLVHAFLDMQVHRNIYKSVTLTPKMTPLSQFQAQFHTMHIILCKRNSEGRGHYYRLRGCAEVKDEQYKGSRNSISNSQSHDKHCFKQTIQLKSNRDDRILSSKHMVQVKIQIFNSGLVCYDSLIAANMPWSLIEFKQIIRLRK